MPLELDARKPNSRSRSGKGLVSRKPTCLCSNEARPVTTELLQLAIKVFHLPPTALPLEADSLSTLDESASAELGALGYPGFSYLRGKVQLPQPSSIVALAPDQDSLDPEGGGGHLLAGYVSGHGLGVAHTQRQAK